MVSISQNTPGSAKGNSKESTEGISNPQSLELVDKGDAKGIDEGEKLQNDLHDRANKCLSHLQGLNLTYAETVLRIAKSWLPGRCVLPAKAEELKPDMQQQHQTFHQ